VGAGHTRDSHRGNRAHGALQQEKPWERVIPAIATVDSRPWGACMVTRARNLDDGRCRDGRDYKGASDLLVQTVGDFVPIPSPLNAY